MLHKLAVLTVVFLLAQSGASMAKTRVIKRKAAYGQGINALIQDAQTLPTAYNLALQAVADADQWWAGQGSPTPAAQIGVTDNTYGAETSSAYGFPGTGQIEFRAGYLQHLDRLLTSSKSPRVRRTALAQMWGLVAHERGHNIGYDHDRGGIMDPNLPGIPGQAYQWAAQMLPSKKVLRKRRGGRY